MVYCYMCMMCVNSLWLVVLGMCCDVCRYCVLVVLGGSVMLLCLFIVCMLVWYSRVSV